MTPDELSRKLAEHFEPKPEFPYMLHAGQQKSHGGFWIQKVEWRKECEVVPTSYTEAGICLRLLKWGMKHRGFLAFLKTIDSTNPSFEQAVAEAVWAAIGDK